MFKNLKKYGSKATAFFSFFAVLSFVSAAHAEDSVVATGVADVVSEIGTYPVLVAAIGVASLVVVLAVRAFGWLKSAIK